MGIIVLSGVAVSVGVIVLSGVAVSVGVAVFSGVNDFSGVEVMVAVGDSLGLPVTVAVGVNCPVTMEMRTILAPLLGFASFFKKHPANTKHPTTKMVIKYAFLRQNILKVSQTDSIEKNRINL
jgi:hypothetical protein